MDREPHLLRPSTFSTSDFFADCKPVGSKGLNYKRHLTHLAVPCHSSEAELSASEVLGEVSSHDPSMKNHIHSGVAEVKDNSRVCQIFPEVFCT